MQIIKEMIQQIRKQEDPGAAAAWIMIYVALGGWYLTLCRAFWPF